MTEIPPNSKMELVSITHSLENDPYLDPDYLGKFVPYWEKNAIRTDDRWFVSENNRWSNWKESWKYVDEADKLKVIKEHGSLKAASFHYAKEDLKRLKDFYSGKWYFQTIIVTATITFTIGGVSISTELIETLGGIESDYPLEELKNTIEEVRSSLISQLTTIGFTEADINATKKRS